MKRNADKRGGERGPRKSLSWFSFLLGLWIVIVSIGAHPREQAAGSQGAEAKKKKENLKPMPLTSANEFLYQARMGMESHDDT